MKLRKMVMCVFHIFCHIMHLPSKSDNACTFQEWEDICQPTPRLKSPAHAIPLSQTPPHTPPPGGATVYCAYFPDTYVAYIVFFLAFEKSKSLSYFRLSVQRMAHACMHAFLLPLLNQAKNRFHAISNYLRLCVKRPTQVYGFVMNCKKDKGQSIIHEHKILIMWRTYIESSACLVVA